MQLAELKLPNYYLALRRKKLAEPCSGDLAQDTLHFSNTGCQKTVSAKEEGDYDVENL